MEKKSKKSRKVIDMPRKANPIIERMLEALDGLTPDDVGALTEAYKGMMEKIAPSIFNVASAPIVESPPEYRYHSAALALDTLTTVAERAKRLEWEAVVDYCADIASKIIEPPDKPEIPSAPKREIPDLGPPVGGLVVE